MLAWLVQYVNFPWLQEQNFVLFGVLTELFPNDFIRGSCDELNLILIKSEQNHSLRFSFRLWTEWFFFKFITVIQNVWKIFVSCKEQNYVYVTKKFKIISENNFQSVKHWQHQDKVHGESHSGLWSTLSNWILFSKFLSKIKSNMFRKFVCWRTLLNINMVYFFSLHNKNIFQSFWITIKKNLKI